MLAVAGALVFSPHAHAQAPAPPPPPVAAPAAIASDEGIGSIATVSGAATVTHAGAPHALKVNDEIYKGDVLQTGADGALGVTFDDDTTFNLTANAMLSVDDFLYEEGGSANTALFKVARGTVAFIASQVAKTGSMTIATPSATMGIRGTTGVVEVPEGAAANNPANVAIKLYPDADGRVGRIEVFGTGGERLGLLSRGATGFTIRPGTGGGRFTAVPLQISAQQAARDRGFVRQTVSVQSAGRQMVIERRNLRQPGQQPGLQRQQPGPQRPGAPGRPGQPNFQRQPGQNQPGLPGQRGQSGGLPRPAALPPAGGSAGEPGLRTPAGVPGRPGPQRALGSQGQPGRGGGPGQPASAPRTQGLQGAPGAPAQSNLQRGMGQRGVPGAHRGQGAPRRQPGAPAGPRQQKKQQP